MKDLINFQYGSQQMRTIIRDDEPWFVAKDVCECLELDDTSKAVARLDNDEKDTNSIPTLGGKQDMLTVNEPGLYSLILGSRKPEAKAFKRWVTHEVLPAIRRTGSYSTAPAPVAPTVNDPVIAELTKRLTLSEIITLFEARAAVEGPHRNSDRFEIVTQTPPTRKRGHSKIDKLGFGELVKTMVRNGHEYQEITDVINAQGHDISRSSVNRYGLRYLKQLNRTEIRMASGLCVSQEIGKPICH